MDSIGKTLLTAAMTSPFAQSRRPHPPDVAGLSNELD
jgi:hypothetical protein